MGLLDILNGMQNGPHGQTQPGKGGMSPLTMAMLALLAYKAYQQLGASQPSAVPNSGNAAGGGGLGGGLGGMLGGLLGGGGLGGLLQGGTAGGLGGLLGGGAAGSVLSGGLNDLLHQLQQSGHGDIAKSWVGTGANQPISPEDLGKALGDDTVNSLAEQAGLSKIDMLNGMSEQLPQLVDRLTPHGSVPDEHEMSKLI